MDPLPRYELPPNDSHDFHTLTGRTTLPFVVGFEKFEQRYCTRLRVGAQNNRRRGSCREEMKWLATQFEIVCLFNHEVLEISAVDLKLKAAC